MNKDVKIEIQEVMNENKLLMNKKRSVCWLQVIISTRMVHGLFHHNVENLIINHKSLY